VGEGKAVAPSFLLACVLWPDVKTGWEQRLARGEHAFPALQEAIDAVFDQRIGDVSGRGKLAADMREIWVMQPRFEKRSGSTPFGMVAHIRFRAGFDFLRLRADVGEVGEGLVEWWQEFSITDDARRQDMIAQAREEQRQQQRKAAPVVRRVPKAPAAAAPAPQGDEVEEVPATAADGAAPKKRRRRRRKPAGGEGSAAPEA
jgi:poly(A) polymerase